MSTKARLNLRYQGHHQEHPHTPSSGVHRPSTSHYQGNQEHHPHTPSGSHRPSNSNLYRASRKRKASGIQGRNEEDFGSPVPAVAMVPIVPVISPIVSPGAVPEATPPIVSDASPTSSVVGDQLVPCEDWQTSTDEEDVGLYTTTCKKR